MPKIQLKIKTLSIKIYGVCYKPYGRSVTAIKTSQRLITTDRWSVGVAKKKAQDEW